MGRDAQACRFDRAAPQPRAALQHRADDADRSHSACGDERQRARPDALGASAGWWKKPFKELPATFNARAETVAEKPMFRTAFKTRRCTIPASGFYEWTGKAGAKTPHYFSARSGEPLAFAALWEQAKNPDTGEPLTLTTIIVGAANNWMNRFHDRQPVILDWRDANAWMRGDDPGALLRTPPEDSLKEWIVSTRVNKAGVGDDDESLVDPVEDLVP